MSFVITGATGHFGRLVVESLLERGVPAADITAVGRSTGKIAELAERGVNVVAADYLDPATLDVAFAGAERALLVSGSEYDDRAGQHRNVVDAAQRAGVKYLAYTSIANAPTSSLILAADHQATEAYIEQSGLPYTFLRNSWYAENYTGQLPAYVEHGIAGSAGTGKVSVATREDYAEAAAAVLTSAGHEFTAYGLGGEPVSLEEIARVVSDVTGRTVAYTDVPVETFTGILVSAGLPEPVATILADADRGLSLGDLEVDPAPLEALIGRPATPFADAVKAAAAAL